MAKNINVEKNIHSGNVITIHKETGKIRANCVYARSCDEIPAFLLEDGAIEVIDAQTIRLYAVEGPADRKFPVYICWEEASEEKCDKVPGKYGSWSKDNGDTTLKVVDGKCYNLPANVTAVLMTEELPAFVQAAGFPVARKGNEWELIRTDWGGDVRVGTIGQAFWCEYAPGDINILAITEPSAKEYLVSVDGEDVGRLVDLF